MFIYNAAADREADHTDLAHRYLTVRSATRRLVEPLSVEDCMVQSMPDASPVKWHLAHTSWFFETFVLSRAGVTSFDPSFAVLFNSYYQSVGPQHPRPQRGVLSRPSLATVWRYRAAIDEEMLALLDRASVSLQTREVIELGLQHEQQHQELILTDIKHALWHNSPLPTYGGSHVPAHSDVELGWRPFEGGLRSLGHAGADFSFDNERPRHRVFVEPFELATRLVTAGEYLAFMDDGGYQRSELWLSEGWDWLARERVTAPLYWLPDDGRWQIYTLAGARPLDMREPVAHMSLYEADAYARWAGARLPREHELEIATQGCDVTGNFVDAAVLHPRAAAGRGMQQLFGDAWEWTQSSYAPYPGYQPAAGALGEYNGKFMCNQYVLRGGSCFSPESHLRSSYRNFFPAHARWQMSGIRLGRDV